MMDNNESYIYGLLITDGNLYLTTRNRGKVSLEISEKDEDIIDKLISIVPNSHKHKRTRKTNFSNSSKLVRFTNSRMEFRKKLIDCGFPILDKTNNANIPSSDYDEISFWRGVIDGDGSIGVTSKNEPFISLVTKSENLKENYLKFLNKKLGITKHLHRNKRDNVYNIVVKNKNAKDLSQILYSNEGVHLNRKFNKAKYILENFQY